MDGGRSQGRLSTVATGVVRTVHEAMSPEHGRLGDRGDPEAIQGSDSMSAQRCEPLRPGLSPRDPHMEHPMNNVWKVQEGAGPCLAACRVPVLLASSNGTRLCHRASTLACRSGAQDVADAESHDAQAETGGGTKPLTAACKRGAWGIPGTWTCPIHGRRVCGRNRGSRLLLVALSSMARY